MSFYQMEDLVEVSIVILAQRAPTHPLKESICFCLYQMQEQFDCSYTVMRVENELEKLNYLFRVPVEKLPEPEQKQARNLLHDGGFLPDGTFVHEDSGLCYVTAGSELWEKLLTLDVLPPSVKVEVKRDLTALDMMEVLLPLAAEDTAECRKNGEKVEMDPVRGLWYALFPVLWDIHEGSSVEPPEPDRLQTLLGYCADPLVFTSAEFFFQELDFEDMDDDEAPFIAQWAEPYATWKEDQ